MPGMMCLQLVPAAAEPLPQTWDSLVRLTTAIGQELTVFCPHPAASLVSHAGPWPAQVHQALPPGYIALAEACWARQRTRRPSAQEVLQRLLDLLAQVEAPPPAKQGQP